MTIGALVLALVLSPSCPRPALQGVALLHELPSGLADLESLAGFHGGSTVVLRGIALAPLDVVGRSALTRSDPQAARLARDVGGAARVLLPGGRGSLYRYRRPVGEATSFGHFVVEPGGAVRLLGERPGLGAGFAEDPFLRRVALTGDGGTVLLVTRGAAGGEILELDLEGGSLNLRTPAGPPLEVRAAGLALLDTFGVLLTPEGPWRFARRPGATAAPVRPAAGSGPAPFAHVGPDLVWSADGSRVAFVAGASATAAHVWVLGASGPARRASTTPMEVSGAGYLPGYAFGPTLALSPDGRAVAWQARRGEDKETFVRALGPNGPGPEIHLTSGVRFSDTLNDTGVIAFFSPTELVFLMGENYGTDIRGADFYRAELGAGGEIRGLWNLSRTSGDLTVPFDEYGELTTRGGVLRLPGTLGYLMVQAEDGADGLLRVPIRPAEPPQVLLGDVHALELATPAGDERVLALRRRSPGDPLELHRWRPLEADRVEFLGSLGSGNSILSQAGSALGRFAALVETPAGLRLGRLDLGFGAVELLAPRSPLLDDRFEPFPDGTLVGSLRLDTASRLFRWNSDGSLTLLAARVGPQRVLPSR